MASIKNVAEAFFAACEAGTGWEGIVNLGSQLTESGHEDEPLSVSRTPFSPEIISHAVWLYHRFCLSFRDRRSVG